MPVEHGALVEPLAVALHGINRGGVGSDRPAAVVGAGPIGVMTALALRARGTERLVVLEPNELRRERMDALGIPAVGLDGAGAAVRAELGSDPAVVYECAGHPSAPALAIDLVGPAGCVVLLGALDEPVEISQMTLIVKEADLRASFGYRPGDFTEAVALLAAGRIPVDQVVTAVEPLERAEEMFDALERPGSEHLKVLLRP
jgi:2-desacetyl-2-hydroxyethyl bacteriochlorophyllide A dehydrogenase